MRQKGMGIPLLVARIGRTPTYELVADRDYHLISQVNVGGRTTSRRATKRSAKSAAAASLKVPTQPFGTATGLRAGAGILLAGGLLWVIPCRPAHLRRRSAIRREAEEGGSKADIGFEGRLAPGKRPHSLAASNGRV
jgi:hypothetical protein